VLLYHVLAQSYSVPQTTAVDDLDIERHAVTSDVLSQWTSKRIRAVEGSHLVLARYSHKSSTSQDDEPTGL